MDINILKSVLKEYEKKQLINSENFERQKSELYSKYPQLQLLDDKINSLNINIAKSALNNIDSSKLKQDLQNTQKEKKDLLNKLGISLENLDINYECKKCKDTGYITTPQGTHMCNCLKQKVFNLEFNNSNNISIANNNFNNFNFNLYSDECNSEKYFSKISPRENIKTIVKISKEFINSFDSTEQKNLILSGGTGLGKTYLSNCIANELISLGKTVLYQTAPIMLDMIIADNFKKPNEQTHIMENILSVDLLIIDDLGTETINSMKFTELYKIINTRLLNNKKTIISTNLDLQNLYNTYDERLVSRFVGFYNAYRFFGEDIRFQKK